MTVSLFSQLVARGAAVPVVDPRITTHPDVPRVDTQDQGSAAQAVETADATEPEAQQVHQSTESPTEAMAPSGGV